MAIDWLTVAAQVVNFLILVYLLRRFLYGPITRAMARREESIGARLREARERAEAAEHEARAYRTQREALEADRARLVAEAREAAEGLRHALEAALREEIDETRARWKAQAEAEREAFLGEVRRQTVRHFAALARRVLADLADARLEEQMARVFVERVRRLDEPAARRLAAAARSAGGRLLVATAFPLPPDLEADVARALREAVGGEGEVVFEQSADLLCGIEARAGGQTVGWHLDGYLDGLEADLDEALVGLTARADRGAA